MDSGGNLLKLFDKLPTLGDDFMLQISYDFVQRVPNNENSLINEPIGWRQIWLTIAYKSPPTARSGWAKNNNRKCVMPQSQCFIVYVWAKE